MFLLLKFACCLSNLRCNSLTKMNYWTSSSLFLPLYVQRVYDVIGLNVLLLVCLTEKNQFKNVQHIRNS